MTRIIGQSTYPQLVYYSRATGSEASRAAMDARDSASPGLKERPRYTVELERKPNNQWHVCVVAPVEKPASMINGCN